MNYPEQTDYENFDSEITTIPTEEFEQLVKAKQELEAIKKGQQIKLQTKIKNSNLILQVKASNPTALRFFSSFLWESMKEGKIETLFASGHRNTKAEFQTIYPVYQNFRLRIPVKILQAIENNEYKFTSFEEIKEGLNNKQEVI